MRLSHKFHRCYFHCLWAGCVLMSFALFLHPMSPRDFLALALSAPFDSMRDSYGIQAAALFWISMIVVCVGMAGSVCCNKYFQRLVRPRSKAPERSANAYCKDIEENWIFL
jgi:hypothetical protein